MRNRNHDQVTARLHESWTSWLVVFSLFTLTNSVSLAQSSFDQGCLIQLQKKGAKPYRRARLVFKDQTSLSGTLLAVFPDSSKLMIGVQPGGLISTIDLTRDEVVCMQVWKPGKMRPLWGFVGFFAGQVIGQRIEGIVDPGSPSGWQVFPFQRPVNNEAGTFIGAAAGAVAGLVLSMIVPSAVSIRCQ